MAEQLTHWKKEKNPNYLGSWDLVTGANADGEPFYGTMDLTIKEVKQEQVTDMEKVKKGQMGTKLETVIYFKENVKPMIIHATCNFKSIASATHTPFVEKWIGKRITIYVDKVKAFGNITDALRIKDYPPKDNILKFYCENCKKEIVKSNSLTPEQLANYTRNKYGKSLCAECAALEKKKLEENKND